MADYTVKQHDTAPPLKATLSDASGVLNLTAAASVMVYLKSDSPQHTITGTCSVVSAPAGTIRYDWQTGDTDVPATYQGEFEVTWNDGTVETFPNDGYFSFIIKADLG